MVFSSIPFLYYFLPISLALYFLVPKKLKNAALLLTSLVFYGWTGPKFVLLMVVSILQGYIFGLLIEKSGRRMAKVYLSASVIFSLGMLGYFKYALFFAENISALTGIAITMPKIILPVGISFYTFQILSYTVDVYRKNVPAQRNLIDLAAYIAMFPQLIAGPIVRYSDVARELKTRTHSFEKVSLGIRRFIVGLAKKVLIANTLGELCSIFKASEDKSVLFFWLYAIAYTLHIYFDFSGYSDMAIGLGKIFGFKFCENFNYPYISKSITEFWRRWHMSLGTWFRDYVYIPLGGNRVNKYRWFFNIMVVWLLTGFWHGAAWNFMVWGLYFGVILILEKLFLLKVLDKAKGVRHVYVLITIIISFIIFDSATLSEAFTTVSSMFGAGDYPIVSAEALYYLKSYGPLLIMGIIGATPFVARLFTKAGENTKIRRVFNLFEAPALILLVVVITGYIADGSFNPFLYFRF